MLTKSGNNAGQPNLKIPTKKSKDEMGDLAHDLVAFMRRLADARESELGLFAAQRTLALHRFARAFLPLYHLRKNERAALDFDDLINRAGSLLTEPSVAQWVLFRLDGGVDHILVDEAQDTSPAQWKVIELLAQEFTSGKGARDINRTIFVVGDKKQSIYSFQGADVGAFDRMKLHFSQRLSESNQPLKDLALEHSFRSAPAILALVDSCFNIDGRKALGGDFKHLAHDSDMPSIIELWPVIEKSSAPEKGSWDDPVDLVQDTHHTARLGHVVAKRIKDMIDAGTRIHVKGSLRAVHEGDFLILVRSRSEVFTQIIRACKAQGLAVAGADRLNLSAELAVKDIASLLGFLATPEDCLSLAEALRSPLLGLSEANLYSLAYMRKGYLWAELRQSDKHSETLKVLNDLRDQADYLRPYDIIERILTRHQGRPRLLTRLGPEAEDGIDALLSQALIYEQTDVPSLTGFLTFLQSDDVQIKRQMNNAARQIRVMSVHGAKGLEAPIVILPDCADKSPIDSDELITLESGLLSWKTSKFSSPKIIKDARQKRQDQAQDEELRLLYVALTRAQSHLIVAAAGRTTGANAWYNQIQVAMRAIGAATQADGRMIYTQGVWPTPLRAAASSPDIGVTLPDWARLPAVKPQRPLQAVSPSGLTGAKAVAGPQEDSDFDATSYGTLVHLLLEYFPQATKAARPALAAKLLSDTPEGETIAREAMDLLDNPALDFVFGPCSFAEVSITASVDGFPILGKIDRLVVMPDYILAVDFKSNRLQPALAKDVPLGILAQMRAYALALAKIYPNLPIRTAILWTKTGQLMKIDQEILDRLPSISVQRV
jgi:ATP-dependent helicase/nuclease subunit A